MSRVLTPSQESFPRSLTDVLVGHASFLTFCGDKIGRANEGLRTQIEGNSRF